MIRSFGGTMKPRCISMRVILFKDGTQWMTHSLNFDACIDSRIRTSVMRELGETIQTQIDASHGFQDPLEECAQGGQGLATPSTFMR